MNPRLFDQLLLSLTTATPPYPTPWEWPTDAFPPEYHDASVELGRLLLSRGDILPIDNPVTLRTTQLYIWSRTITHGGSPMGLPEPAEPQKFTILHWLRQNTPTDGWWTLKHRLPIGDPRSKKKRYETNPVYTAMKEAGVSYAAAYMAASRADELGLLIKATRDSPHWGYWKWVQLGQGGATNDPEIQHLLGLYGRLSDARQLAFMNCISAKPLGDPFIKTGDYEIRAPRIELDPHEGLLLRGALHWKGKKLYQTEAPLLDPDREKNLKAQEATPADETEATTIAKHRAEMAELAAAADFSYNDEDQPNE